MKIQLKVFNQGAEDAEYYDLGELDAVPRKGETVTYFGKHWTTMDVLWCLRNEDDGEDKRSYVLVELWEMQK